MDTTPSNNRPAPTFRSPRRAVRWGVVILVGLSAALLIDLAQQSLASDRVAWAQLTTSDLDGVTASAVTTVSNDSYATSSAAAELTDRPRLIRFTADWCGPCQTMKAQVFAQSSVADAIHERFAPFNVDLTRPGIEQAALGQRYAIQFVPTLLITDAHGREISRLENAADADAFLAWLHRGWNQWSRDRLAD